MRNIMVVDGQEFQFEMATTPIQSGKAIWYKENIQTAVTMKDTLFPINSLYKFLNPKLMEGR